MSEKDFLMLGSAVVDLAVEYMSVSRGPESVKQRENHEDGQTDTAADVLQHINISGQNIYKQAGELSKACEMNSGGLRAAVTGQDK